MKIKLDNGQDIIVPAEKEEAVKKIVMDVLFSGGVKRKQKSKGGYKVQRWTKEDIDRLRDAYRFERGSNTIHEFSRQASAKFNRKPQSIASMVYSLGLHKLS